MGVREGLEIPEWPDDQPCPRCGVSKSPPVNADDALAKAEAELAEAADRFVKKRDTEEFADGVLAEAAIRMPNYYRLPGLFLADGSPADAMHLVENVWPDSDNFCEKDVLKYLLRAGRKPGVPAARDWLKIVRVAARKYRRLSGEELPDDV